MVYLLNYLIIITDNPQEVSGAKVSHPFSPAFFVARDLADWCPVDIEFVRRAGRHIDQGSHGKDVVGSAGFV